VGFHPRESLVVLAIRPDQEVHCTLRVDLPPDVATGVDESALLGFAVHLADVVFRHGTTHALLVAYTSSPAEVSRVLETVHLALETAGVLVLDRLVADGQRWWSDACRDPECCPPTGTAYDLAHHPVTARSVFAGEVALADEDALRRSIAPADSESSPELREHIAQVEAEFERGCLAEAGPDQVGGEAVVRMLDARRYVSALVETGAGISTPLTDDQVARVCVLVADGRVKAEVAKLITPETAGVHQELWTQVLRRSVEPHDAGPATLLAFPAWSSGQGALARCALDRALAGDPDCPMASFVAELLARGVAPRPGHG
jgi:hypothetical protein